jgi:hypothetical protein
MSGSPGSSDNDFQAALFGVRTVANHPVRCAVCETNFFSNGTLNEASVSAARCIVGQSDLLPITTATVSSNLVSVSASRGGQSLSGFTMQILSLFH